MTEHLESTLQIVVGLPGSGKSTLIHRLLEAGEIDTFYDDYQKGAPEEDKSDPRKSPNFLAVSEDIQAGKRVIIADIRYCIQQEVELMLNVAHEQWPGLPVTVISFENNPDACKHNVCLRNRSDYVDNELRFIDEHTSSYRPSGERILPVIMG